MGHPKIALHLQTQYDLHAQLFIAVEHDVAAPIEQLQNKQAAASQPKSAGPVRQ